MKNLYNMNTRHHVLDATQSYYHDGFIHPNRILSHHDWIYILNGHWTIYQEEEVFDLYPDDLLILQANCHHYGMESSTNQLRDIYVHLSAEEGDSALMTLPDNLPNDTVVLDSLYHCQDNPCVKEYFTEMSQEFISPKRPYVLSHLADSIILELQKMSEETIRHSRRFARDIYTLIQDNPSKTYSLDELCEALLTSKRTLLRIVKEETGLSVHQFLLNVKIQLARAKINMQPRLPLRSLAEELGFYDEFHLSKVFKSFTGVSPQSYRKLYLNEAPTNVEKP